MERQDDWHAMHIELIIGRELCAVGRAMAEATSARKVVMVNFMAVAIGRWRLLETIDAWADLERIGVGMRGEKWQLYLDARKMHWLSLLHHGQRSLCSIRAGLRIRCERDSNLHGFLRFRSKTDAVWMDRYLAQTNTVSVTLDGQDFDIHKRAGVRASR